MSLDGPIDEIPEGDGGGGGGGGYVPPDYASGDWARIADLVAGRTDYRSANFARREGAAVNLDGVYSVVSAIGDTIVLANPETVNPAWEQIVTATAYASPTLSTQGEGWVGPFIITQPGVTELVLNIYAPQGVYLVTEKGKNRARSVQARIEATPVDLNGNPTGVTQVATVTVAGDGRDKQPKGETLRMAVTESESYSIRVRRLTNKDYGSKSTIVDEIKWRDLFATSPITEPHFGDVTILATRTYATSGATGVKERKLNCRATRRVLKRNFDDTFGPALVASRNAADIICHMALDPIIGGRSLSELDVPQIYGEIAEAVSYFGIPDVGRFGYTFDQNNLSYEEMVQAVAQASFCTAYRQGSVLRLFLEKATEDSTLLFNHRNKIPGSEKRTVKFGRYNDNDGVEFDYVSEVDGAKLTIYLPEDQSAVKPKKVEIDGVQTLKHGRLHAERAWAKIRYQHTAVEFAGLAEATQLIRGERIEVTDNTRPDVFDGHVTEQDGLTLTLTQPLVAVPGVEYTIFLQNPQGGVETRAITPTADPHRVVLQEPTAFAIITDPDVWADTTYQIVGNDAVRSSAFLLTEKGAYDKRQISVQAINYDHRYYGNDFLYKDL